ncbi:GerMN domain-containing protein [Brevibacillus fulvus]|uniref:Germination protein M n=1 Tax=Brevibacillus fulvus TaxID=1125967 RepID=A0A938XY96_9BACL|nr:GerMN domain-containing protein [Brevibacillus fulvus]MBM7590066.1 germination protein M [Brevibacillus fulvus]
MGLRRIGKVTAVLGVSTVLLTGCGLFGPEQETSSIDAPPQADVVLEEKPAGAASGNAGEAAEQVQGTAERTVYLFDPNGYVVPVSLTLPKEEGAAKQVLTYMVKGGPVETMLPTGFSPVLPEGTKVLGMTIKEGTATVDFSKEFKNYSAEQEKPILDAISRALTEFKTIKNVSIWVNGTPLSEMPVDNTPISLLNRDTGINVELAEGAIPGRTTPVTVYFQGQLDDQRSYLVPVTRLIPETDDVARAVVEELIKGPKEGSPLYSSILSTTKVLDVNKKADTVTVNLSDDLLKYDNGKEANPEAIESLLLSLTENTGANKVQVMVDGKPVTSGAFDFSKPVDRPLQINSMQF